jgi:hypothetical protein
MSDVVLLRKLTRKSMMNFGKYYDLTVQEIIDLLKHKYLRWVYFNCSNIDFFEDVLDEIKIPLEFRIIKPSKKPILHEQCNEYILDGFPEYFKQKVLEKNSYRSVKINNAISINKLNKNKNHFRKDYLARKNHGH